MRTEVPIGQGARTSGPVASRWAAEKARARSAAELPASPDLAHPLPVPAVLLAITLLLAAPVRADCAGDCDADGRVRVEELIGLVGCALGVAPQVAPCLTCADGDASGAIDVHDLVAAVAHALDGCPTFTVSVTLEEFPGEGSQIGACVTLQPLGRRTDGPPYAFTDLPPGRYEIEPALACGGPPCNPFGCWPSPVPVEIVDRDVTITIPLRRPSCRRHADCGTAGAQCVAPDGFLCGVCRDDPDACVGDRDCEAAQVCVPTRERICPCDGSPALVCAPACAVDADCARGERCGGDGRCVRPTCRDDGDCGGDVCVLGRCYDERGSCQLPPP